MTAAPGPDTVAAPARIRREQFGPIVVDYDERVLAPRLWTLMQSEWAAELASHTGPGPILELCAGAGQIGLVAALMSGRDLVQVERNPVAAGFAERNARAAGYADRTEVRAGPMQQMLGEQERFPVLIADPPYLPSVQVGEWAEDPVQAIDGGADGLDLVRICLAVAARHLSADGHLLLQVAGPDQARQVQRELPAGLVARDTRTVDARRAVLHLSR
jgi:methylase of polypeptide subunit release factors